MEIDTTSERIADVEGSTIVAGDFNAAPWSRAMRLFLVGSGAELQIWLSADLAANRRHVFPLYISRPRLTVKVVEALSDLLHFNQRRVIH